MNTIKFSTPFGFIEVLKNGLPVAFDIVNGSDYFDGYPLNDGTKLYPLGLYTIIIPIQNTDVGDTFIVRYSKGELKDDGGQKHAKQQWAKHFSSARCGRRSQRPCTSRR